MGDIGVFKVSSTTPKNQAVDVGLKVDIEATFNLDVDLKTTENAIFVFEQNTRTAVLGSLAYDRDMRIISFRPSRPLKPSTTYEVTISASVKSILGQSLRAYTYSFKTNVTSELSAPRLIEPINLSSIHRVPELKWISELKSIGYEIQLSQSSTFATYDWTTHINCLEEVTERIVTVTPDIILSENIVYYWRVRAIDKTNSNTETHIPPWSETYRFHLLSEDDPLISLEDTMVDPIFDDAVVPEFRLLSLFPELNFSNVATNLKSIYTVIDGIIENPTELDPTKWIIEGRHLLDNDSFSIYDPDASTKVLINVHHGQVMGRWSVILDEEAHKSYIILTPNKL